MATERAVDAKKARAGQANALLTVIAGTGRQFFRHQGRVSQFEVDPRGRIWFVDAYRPARIYMHCSWSRWRGFSEGGTLRALVQQLVAYIKTGVLPALSLGPWPEWACDGDPWGYGQAMLEVRTAAAALRSQYIGGQHGIQA